MSFVIITQMECKTILTIIKYLWSSLALKIIGQKCTSFLSIYSFVVSYQKKKKKWTKIVTVIGLTTWS